MKKPVIFFVAAMLIITLMPMAAFGENTTQEPYRCSRENCTVENCQYGEACPYAIDDQGCNSGGCLNSGEGAYCYNDGDNYCRRDRGAYRAEDATYRTDENTYRRGYRNNGGHCRSSQYNNGTF